MKENLKGDRIRHAMKEEKERIIKHYQEQMQKLKKVFESLQSESNRNEHTEKSALAYLNGKNAIALADYEESKSTESGGVMRKYELKMLEIESKPISSSKPLPMSSQQV